MNAKVVGLITPKWSTIKLGLKGSMKTFKPIESRGLTAQFDADSQVINLFKNNNLLGQEQITFSKDVIKGDDIEIFAANRGQGFGKLIRALSAMIMKQNKVKVMRIDSLPEAVGYHYKYGFKPYFASEETAISSLRKITQNTDGRIADLTNEAKVLYNEIMGLKYSVHAANSLPPPPLSHVEKGCKAVIAEFFDKFLKRTSTDKIKCEEIKFPSSIKMELSQDSLLKNNNKYNKIFEDFGINYII